MVFKVKETSRKDVNIQDHIFWTPPKERMSFLRFTLICLIFLLSVALFIGAVNLVVGRSPVRYCIEMIIKYNDFEPVCSGIPDIEKFDCYPDAPVTESECINRGCCYSVPKNASNSLPPLNIPYCYYSANYVGYKIKDVVKTSRRMLVKLQRVFPSGFQKDVSNLDLLISFIDDNIIRLKITDEDSQRYEVPIQLKYEYKELNIPLYDVIVDSSSGVLTIKRKSSGTIVFSTNLSRLVYSDQFLQLSSNLPSKYVYGIGEHYGGLIRSVNWTRFTMINSDLPPIPNHGLYGSHPFYMSLEKGGNASGVFLFNSNIMDVILQPTPAITFRPIGGILDFFVMLGPSPKAVTEQYSSIVGKTFMPPFWSFGFHLCRFGYKTLNKTREVMQRTIDAKIPLEVQWNDIDYMDNYKDFTYDKMNFYGLPEFVDNLHSKELRYIVMTDPGLSNSEKMYPPYDEGVDDDIFVKNANGSIFVGKVWTSGTTVFPDFSHPAAIPFWTRQFKSFYNEVKFDGVWIDMNEPSNFWNGGVDGCPKSSLETPQYVPGGNILNTKTVCMSAKHYYTTHYNEHNIYGYREAVATDEALRSVRRKRPFIISRATFPGQGVHSGHWSGDVSSTWEDMRYSVSSLINFNMYAIPMVGTDICGFNGNTTVELCARWQSVGAFYPFSRNHNERITIEQDPVALGPVVVDAAKISLMKRYALLHYLYTLFYRSHTFGETVVRPLYFEFPQDVNTYSIDEQFLWGASLMIIPVLYPNTTTVNAYFPKGLWYQDIGIKLNSSGEHIALDIPISDIFLYFRGGSILPGTYPAMTTADIQRNPIILAVALDEDQKACGELYLDDGDSLETYENGFYNLIQFEAKPGHLNSSIINSGYQKEVKLELIQFGGLNQIPNQVTLNGNMCISSPPEVFTTSGKRETSSNVKENRFFHLDAELNKIFLGNASCKFYMLENVFNIYTQPVSLLSPLSVSWK